MRKPLIVAFLLTVAAGVAVAAGMMINPHRFGSGADYSDIIFYHDCNAKDAANKAGGSDTVTYTANWDLATDNSETPLIGSDSWDHDNDDYERCYWETSGNVDFAGGRIGLYFRPRELASGRIVATSTSTYPDANDFIAQFLSADDIQVTYMGTTEQFTDVNLSADTTYFVEFKFTGSACEMFIDGGSIGTTTGSGTPDDTYFFVGSYDNSWDALYDQVISSNDEDRDLNAIKDVTNFD